MPVTGDKRNIVQKNHLIFSNREPQATVAKRVPRCSNSRKEPIAAGDVRAGAEIETCKKTTHPHRREKNPRRFSMRA
jgi:hypothetical protein